jgi:hypothetical protein
MKTKRWRNNAETSSRTAVQSSTCKSRPAAPVAGQVEASLSCPAFDNRAPGSYREATPDRSIVVQRREAEWLMN